MKFASTFLAVALAPLALAAPTPAKELESRQLLSGLFGGICAVGEHLPFVGSLVCIKDSASNCPSVRICSVSLLSFRYSCCLLLGVVLRFIIVMLHTNHSLLLPGS